MCASGLSSSDFDSLSAEERLLTDFTVSGTDLGWYVVNDNVMGGKSDGGFRVDGGNLHFTGRTNTNGGGFSSIRTGPLEADLSRFEGIRLRLKGDGRRYTWRLTTDARWRGREVAYWAEFDTEDGKSQTVDIPFDRFEPRFRGSRLDGPELDTGIISSMGLMIYDGLDGAFDLRLASVTAYPEPGPFSLKQYRWRHRVLVLSAPDDDNRALNQQQAAVSTSRSAFSERDMVLITLVDNGASSAGDRALTDNEVATIRRALGISAGSFAIRLVGKDGAVKLSEDTATPMDEIYGLIDTMPMRQQEMSGQ